MGPFTPSARGFKYLIVAIDVFTRFVELIPVRTLESVEAARAVVNEVFLRYGFPDIVRSDNGTQFTSKIFESMIKELDMKHHKTIAYRPQSNGIVERANREILRILRYAVIDGDKHWVEMLPVARFVLNTSFHSSTGTTPFMLVMGREGDPRRDLFLSKAEEGFFKNYSECEEKTKDFLGKLREEALKEQIATRKKKHSRDEEIERPVEGTFVWLLPVGKKKGKLQKRRRGPFQVEKVMPNFL
ncbi:unnamed protein product, partial [Aduncisulcus paluster]